MRRKERVKFQRLYKKGAETDLACECVVDVKARDATDAGPCGHGHHEEEEELCTWRGKGE
jgi:hypothetical protein